MKDIQIIVAKEFTRTPGVRTLQEGEGSGDLFLRTKLYPKFREAVQRGVKLIVNLDGTAGYATSFLEAAFGGLVRGDSEFGIPSTDIDEVVKTLEIQTSDKYLREEIMEYMEEASEMA